MSEFNRENFVKNLPDAYAKGTDSNNYKILETERQAGIKLRETLESVYDIIDIDNATGNTLDLYGERVGQLRGEATDDQYRIMIKAKLTRNLANGSYQSICDALCASFGCDKSELKFEEVGGCAVRATAVPVEKINEAGFTAVQAKALMKSMLPVAITLDDIVVGGTFCFAAGEGETDNDAGFTDVEGGTTGGTFSTIFGAEEEIPLPI